MLTETQISAETLDPLTATQKQALLGLVRQYPPYMKASGRWPSLEQKIDTEITTPTVKTQALKAVLTQLNALPSLVVESDGTTNSPGRFTTPENWEALALDVLNVLYVGPTYLGSHYVGVVKRPTESLVQRDRTNFTPRETGKRW